MLSICSVALRVWLCGCGFAGVALRERDRSNLEKKNVTTNNRSHCTEIFDTKSNPKAEDWKLNNLSIWLVVSPKDHKAKHRPQVGLHRRSIFGEYQARS